MSVALAAYRWLTRVVEPLAPRLLDARARRGKEDWVRLDERLGLPGASRPSGGLVWLHGVSVGEAVSLLSLAERFRAERPDLTLLVTTGTVTAARLMAERLPPGAIHQYAPVDAPQAVAGFLNHWRPDLAILAESELWPNLILDTQARGVPLALISARITEKTADGWRRVPGAAQRLLGAFSRILPQDAASAERIRALGGRVDGLANLKLAGGPLPHDPAAFSRLSAAIGDRPVIAAVSTHEGEEMAIVRALDQLDGRIFLILTPRHPERGDAVAAALDREGYRFARRSLGQPVEGATDIYLADTLGETGLALRLADVAVVGGSFAPALGLSPVGGHNPLEPARLGKPALCGPDMSNWIEVAETLARAGGLTVVGAPTELSDPVRLLLDDPAAARAMGERARRAAAEADNGLDVLWRALEPLLPPQGAVPRRERRR